MFSIALAFLVLVCPQDPDRSTPEKATESFLAFWEKLQNEGEEWLKILTDVQALANFCRTEECKSRVAKKSEEQWSRMKDDQKTLSLTNEIVKKTEENDGSVVIDVQQKIKKRKKNFESGQMEEVEESLGHRLILLKDGAHWKVRDLYRPCFMCAGTGQCQACKGTGEVMEQKCYSCEGGRVCKECTGEKMKKEDMADTKFEFVVVDPEPQYSNDLSTAKAAVQTYVDLLVRQGVETTKRFRVLIDQVLVRFRLFFVPTVVKAVEESVAKAIEAGKKRLEEHTPKIESVEEKGDTAHAILTSVAQGGEAQERQQRLVLKKVGVKWLVDGVQNPCWSCQGNGQCSSCQGTGKLGDTDCFGCEGKKTCRGCQGAGWMDEFGEGF